MYVLTTDPLNNAATVGCSRPITVQFSESVNPATVLPSMIVLVGPGGVSLPITYTVSGDRIVVTPNTPFKHSSQYAFYLSKTDFVEQRTIASVSDSLLDKDVILNFYTVGDTPAGENSTVYNTAIAYTPIPEIVNINPSSYVVSGNVIEIEFTSAISDARPAEEIVTLYAEDVLGVEAPLSYTVAVSNRTILVTLDTIPPSCFYYLTFENGIESEEGHIYIEGSLQFVSKPATSLVPLVAIRYKLGSLNQSVTDFDIYVAMMDAAQTLLADTGVNVYSAANDPKLIKILKNTILYTLIERMALEKFNEAGTSVQIGSLSVRKTYPDTGLLEYLKEKLEKELKTTAVSLTDIRVAVRGRYYHQREVRKARRFS